MSQHVVGKIGNMRKSVEWVIYPRNKESIKVLIQSDNRIAEINLESKKVILSDGKGGHQGYHKLSTLLGAKLYDCPQEILDQINTEEFLTGPVRLV